MLDARGAEEISIGDYVLSGGELPAMVLIDACVRLLPGVVGAGASLAEESFETGVLEYPHYTRPRVWEGAKSLTCFCPAITAASRGGGASRRWL